MAKSSCMRHRYFCLAVAFLSLCTQAEDADFAFIRSLSPRFERHFLIQGQDSQGRWPHIPSTFPMAQAVTLSQYLGQENPLWAGVSVKFNVKVEPERLARGDAAAELPLRMRRAFEKTVLRIFTTPTGARWVARTMACEARLISNQLAVGSGTARVIAEHCQKTQKNLPKSRVPFFRSPLASRLFSIELSSEKHQHLTAYSLGYGFTRIFLTYKEFTEEFLTRVLIHEYAVQFDTKAVYQVLDSSLLNESLIAFRAFRMENQILSELGFQPSLSLGSPEDTKTCLKILKKISKAMLPMPFQLWHFRTNVNSGKILTKPIDLSRLTRRDIRKKSHSEVLAERQKAFENDVEQFRNQHVLNSGKLESACSYYSIPAIGIKNLVFPSGPRPRIGTW